MSKLDNIPHREIRNLKQYSEIWGEDCPRDELPYLIVFRGLSFERKLKDLMLELIDQAEEEGEVFWGNGQERLRQKIEAL